MQQNWWISVWLSADWRYKFKPVKENLQKTWEYESRSNQQVQENGKRVYLVWHNTARTNSEAMQLYFMSFTAGKLNFCFVYHRWNGLLWTPAEPGKSLWPSHCSFGAKAIGKKNDPRIPVVMEIYNQNMRSSCVTVKLSLLFEQIIIRK